MKMLAGVLTNTVLLQFLFDVFVKTLLQLLISRYMLLTLTIVCEEYVGRSEFIAVKCRMRISKI